MSIKLTNLSFIDIRTKVIRLIKKLGFSPIDFIHSINKNYSDFATCKEGYLTKYHLEIAISNKPKQ